MNDELKIVWKAKQLEQALSIKVNDDIKGGEIQFNSQHVKKGDIFIALKGANSDGHNYVQDALKNGASLAIVSNKSFAGGAKDTLLVPNCLVALKKLAIFKRNNSKARFVGVTGSAGKTSTKEALGVVLSAFGKTFISRDNFNNDLGVIVNLASMPDDTEYAVIEMGMNHKGEIKELTKQVKPDIAIITSISEGHLEFFESVAEIAASKAEIFEGLLKEGYAIIPADNQHYDFLNEELSKFGIKNIYSFAKNTQANVIMNSYKIINDEVEINYLLENQHCKIILPIIAEHQALNLSICLLVAKILKLDMNIATHQFTKIKIATGRGKIVNVTKGNKIFKIIGDYYNANPESTKAALQYLQAITHTKKVAILGDMLELGESSEALHISLVPYIISSGIKKIFLIGQKIATIEKLIDKSAIEVKSYNNVEQAIVDVESLLDNDELILIKASRSMCLDKIMTYFEDNNK